MRTWRNEEMSKWREQNSAGGTGRKTMVYSTRKGDRQTSSEGTHSSYSHQFRARVHRANEEIVESATIDNILEVYNLWVYQVTVCLRLITLLLWHWLGDAELYDSPVTAGTLSHTQLELSVILSWNSQSYSKMPTINQLNSFAGQTTKTIKTRLPALSVDFLPIHYPWFCTHKCFHFLISPFPHFSFPHFLFLLLGQSIRVGLGVN